MTREKEIFALKQGIAAMSGMAPASRYAAYLALRSVAYNLGLQEVHKDLDARLKALRSIDPA